MQCATARGGIDETVALFLSLINDVSKWQKRIESCKSAARCSTCKMTSSAKVLSCGSVIVKLLLRFKMNCLLISILVSELLLVLI